MLLRERLEQNNYILDCPYCKKKVYKYVGLKPIRGCETIKSSDFKSISKKISQPIPGQEMNCPYCGEALASG
jgi:DNA-directed RNA polymerase subunit RPC12/RpoP